MRERGVSEGAGYGRRIERNTSEFTSDADAGAGAFGYRPLARLRRWTFLVTNSDE